MWIVDFFLCHQAATKVILLESHKKNLVQSVVLTDIDFPFLRPRSCSWNCTSRLWCRVWYSQILIVSCLQAGTKVMLIGTSQQDIAKEHLNKIVAAVEAPVAASNAAAVGLLSPPPPTLPLSLTSCCSCTRHCGRPLFSTPSLPCESVLALLCCRMLVMKA